MAIATANAGGSGLTVTVCYGTGCTGDDNIPQATDARGTPVTVTVRSLVSLVIPSLLGFTSFSPSATSTMLVNH